MSLLSDKYWQKLVAVFELLNYRLETSSEYEGFIGTECTIIVKGATIL